MVCAAPQRYVPALSVGEALSAVLPALLGVVQGPGVRDAFSTRLFLGLMCAVMLVSAGAFYGLRAMSARGGDGGGGGGGGAGFPPFTAAAAAEENPAPGDTGVSSTRVSFFSRELRWAYCGLFAWSFVNNGVFVALVTFMVLPYPSGRTVCHTAARARRLCAARLAPVCVGGGRCGCVYVCYVCACVARRACARSGAHVRCSAPQFRGRARERALDVWRAGARVAGCH